MTIQEISWWAVVQTHVYLPNGSANVEQLNVPNQVLADEMLANVRNIEVRAATPYEWTLKAAKVAAGGRTGNCGEMATVAFALLFMRGVYPIRYMYFPVDEGDHCFVVIGDNDSGWVADPWANNAYPLTEFVDRMNGLYAGNPPDIRNLRMLCCVNFAGSEELFNRITADQETIDAMDISINEADNEVPVDGFADMEIDDGDLGIQPMDVSE